MSYRSNKAGYIFHSKTCLPEANLPLKSIFKASKDTGANFKCVGSVNHNPSFRRKKIVYAQHNEIYFGKF